MVTRLHILLFFFFNDTATTEIYTLSLHDALPISRLPRAVDPGHEVEVRPGDVVAPDDDEPGVGDLLGPDAGDRAEGPHPRLGADSAAERSPIEQARAELVEEPKVHRAAREHAVRARVVERQDRLGAVRGDDRAEPRVDRVERLPPRDTLEAPLASGAHAPERRAEASGAVDELRVRLRHLRPKHATGVRVGVRAADLDDPVLLDRDREAAGVRAIGRADTRSFDAHGRHRTRIARHRGRGNAPVLLQGIRVVEAASMVLVPSAAAMLADFGAEVIKVEPPEGDYNRKMHELPTLPQSEAPYCFLVDGRSKQSIVLDLKATDGVAILHRLVSTTDVFLTNYRAPALARLRLRWDDLAPLNPRLVYASASAFGESGPEADKPGYDTVVYWARSGLESSLLTPEGTLGQLAGGAGDHPTALALFGAVALALFARERSGRGLKVATSLLAAGDRKSTRLNSSHGYISYAVF